MEIICFIHSWKAAAKEEVNCFDSYKYSTYFYWKLIKNSNFIGRNVKFEIESQYFFLYVLINILLKYASEKIFNQGTLIKDM